MTAGFYAHSLEGKPTSEWEPLEDHLRRVAELAGEFAGKFGAAEWGRVAGWWHDVGKWRGECQRRACDVKTHRSHLGALHRTCRTVELHGGIVIGGGA